MPTALPHRITLMQGDIARQHISAIVNAADSSLLGGGGVDGVIHRADGPKILADYQKVRARQGGCRTDEAVITTDRQLPAVHVIHTVGSVWNGGHKGKPELLANCYRNSLRLAEEHRLESITFPSISTDIYGHPKEEVAAIVVREVQQWLATHAFPQKAVFVVFDDKNRQLYE